MPTRGVAHLLVFAALLGSVSCSLTTELDDITGGLGGQGGGSCSSDEQCAHLTDACNLGRCQLDTRSCYAEPHVDVPCDDQDLCTADDRCDAAGECHGTAYACTPATACTTATCDGNGGCVEDVQAGYCLIGDAQAECYAEHAANPADPCSWCDPATSNDSWTQMPANSDCLPDGDPCLAGHCDAEGTCVYEGFQPLDTPCGPAPGACELQDTCDGGGLCIDRGLEPDTTECRSSTGPCDVSEHCTGTGPNCPHDQSQPEGTDCGTCRSCDDDGQCLTNSTDHADCGDCEQCSDGMCVDQAAGEDLKDRCAAYTCSDYVWGANGVDCHAYAGATAVNGFCDGTGSCASVVDSCQTEGVVIASCLDVACVECVQGTEISNPILDACYQDFQQHGCATNYVCGSNGACVPDTGSCPFLYTWAGTEFAFETDLYGSGKLGVQFGSGYWNPTPDDYYVLSHEPVALGGSFELRLVEERSELNYFDSVALVAADVPVGYDVHSELHGLGSPYVPLAQSLHTTAAVLQPPVEAFHLDDSFTPPQPVSILSEIAQSDGVYAVLNNDRDLDFRYQTIELNLGDLSVAPQIKLVIDARTAFPISPAGIARKKLFGAPSKLEVLDGAGQWIEVPKSVAWLPNPKEARRPFVMDITSIFVTNTYRVRLTWLFKTYVDGIRLDTTADLQPALQWLTLESADLRYYGHSYRTPGELFEFVYGAVSQEHWPAFDGYYTRFGTVTPLLDQVDDKFVIFWSGDELALRFAPLPPPVAGTTRRYVLHSHGYYKDLTYTGPHEVEPLPFAAMSNYPYDPTVEHYPDDLDHVLYRQAFNTRWLD